MLKAAVGAIEREFKRCKLPPVVPLVYTRGKGDAELCGAERYWQRPAADDRQFDLWGWRVLSVLKEAVDEARATFEHPSKSEPIKSLMWLYKNILQKLARSAPFEDADAFKRIDLEVALGLRSTVADENAGQPAPDPLCAALEQMRKALSSTQASSPACQPALQPAEPEGAASPNRKPLTPSKRERSPEPCPPPPSSLETWYCDEGRTGCLRPRGQEPFPASHSVWACLEPGCQLCGGWTVCEACYPQLDFTIPDGAAYGGVGISHPPLHKLSHSASITEFVEDTCGDPIDAMHLTGIFCLECDIFPPPIVCDCCPLPAQRATHRSESLKIAQRCGHPRGWHYHQACVRDGQPLFSREWQEQWPPPFVRMRVRGYANV